MPFTAFVFCLSSFDFCLISVIVTMIVLFFVCVIDSKQCTCKCCDLSEADQQALVYLPLGLDKDTTEEHCESSEGEDCGGDELYV